ncbi:MAG: NCS2 family permease [Verrucomicrobiota bacterium]
MLGLNIRRGDWDGFIAAFINNLVQLLIVAPLCLGVLGFSAELVIGRILPGMAVSFLVGNLYYAYLTKKLQRENGRNDICALPYGISTPAVFANIFLIMLPAKLIAEANNLPDPELTAWRAGLLACFLGGLIECAGAFCAAGLRKLVPRVALISTLGGVGLGFLGMAFLFQLMEAPLAGIPVFFLGMALLIRPFKLPIWLPATAIILVAGTTLGWLTQAAPVSTLGLAPLSQINLHLPLPNPSDLIASFQGTELATTLSVVLPISLLGVIASLQNIESAAAAGDAFPERPCLIVNGLGTLAASFFGSPFPTSIYIGHPAWKKMGAGYHYSVLNGLAIAFVCLSGLLATIVWAVPVEAGITIIFWIGLIIVGQAFETAEPVHYPAAIVGMMPGLAAWVIVVVNSLVAGLVTTTDGLKGLQPEYLNQQAIFGNFIAGGISLQQGFLLTAMIWATITVFLIERDFLKAIGFALLAAFLSAVGLMHGYRLESGAALVEIPLLNKLSGIPDGRWIGAPAECTGYLIAAAIFGLFYALNRIKDGQAQPSSQG